MKMKNSILALLGSLLPFAASAQIPNPDMEQWQTINKEKPSQWTVFGDAVKVAGYKSPYAVRVSRNSDEWDAPGAIVYGQPDQGFQGGVPFVGRPDSFVGFFKNNIKPGDTAWVVAILKRNGNFISMTIHQTTGNDSMNFIRTAFAMQYNDTGLSDSAIVGFTSTNPEDTFMGSWVIGDSLHFVGNGNHAKLPNSGFEQWDLITYRDPQGWATLNSRIPSGYPFTVDRTTDHVFGSYAARIQNVSLGGGNFIPGYIMAGRQGDNGPEPGFPVSARDSMMYFNYKFFPKAADSMSVGIMMFEDGNMVGAGFFMNGDTVSTWTQQAVQINYMPLYSGTPDSAVIFCAAFQGGQDPTGESVLFVDGFKLNVPMNNLREIESRSAHLIVFPNPAKTDISVIYTVAEPGFTEVALYNAMGQKVSTIFSGELSSGKYAGSCNLTQLPDGIYYCRVTGNGTAAVQRIILAR